MKTVHILKIVAELKEEGFDIDYEGNPIVNVEFFSETEYLVFETSEAAEQTKGIFEKDSDKILELLDIEIGKGTELAKVSLIVEKKRVLSKLEDQGG